MKYILTIKPAIPPEVRHQLEDTLKKVGYLIWGSGQYVNGEECDISFDDKGGENHENKNNMGDCGYCGNFVTTLDDQAVHGRK